MRARTEAGGAEVPDLLTIFAYRGGAAVARHTPDWLPLFQLGGLAAAAALPRRRTLVGRHQARVAAWAAGNQPNRPVPRYPAWRAFASYAKYWGDAGRLAGYRPEELAARFTLYGRQHLESGMAAGRGVIMALAHLGTWDLSGGGLAAIGFPMTVVVEGAADAGLFRWFVAAREAIGLTVVPSGPSAGLEVLGALRAGRLVGLLCDRNIGGGGVEVEFFGERTTLPAGPATLALRTGAMLLPTGVYDLAGGRCCGYVRPPVDATRRDRLSQDVARVTAAVTSELEWLISLAPTQWHLFQPNWPSDPGYRGPGG